MNTSLSPYVNAEVNGSDRLPSSTIMTTTQTVPCPQVPHNIGEGIMAHVDPKEHHSSFQTIQNIEPAEKDDQENKVDSR